MLSKSKRCYSPKLQILTSTCTVLTYHVYSMISWCINLPTHPIASCSIAATIGSYLLMEDPAWSKQAAWGIQRSRFPYCLTWEWAILAKFLNSCIYHFTCISNILVQFLYNCKHTVIWCSYHWLWNVIWAHGNFKGMCFPSSSSPGCAKSWDEFQSTETPHTIRYS